MSGLQMLLLAAVLITATAALVDYKTGLIPNQITYPLVIIGTIVHFAFDVAMFGRLHLGFVLMETLAGGLICGLVPLLLWRSNAMGGGDVKLLTGVGALLGPALGLRVELYSFMAAVMIAPILLAYRGVLWATLRRSFELMLSPFRRNKEKSPALAQAVTELRFGPAICAAMAVVAVLEWNGVGF